MCVATSATFLRDRKANALVSISLRGKNPLSRKDPKTAEKLIPRNHEFGTAAVAARDQYYEVGNQGAPRRASRHHGKKRRSSDHLRTAARPCATD